MTEWNYDIFKKNINELIKNKHITQAQLAEEIGITQSNLSKNLSEFNKSRFNLDQIVALANFFNISVDELLGTKQQKNIQVTTREICKFIAEILKENCKARLVPVQIEETKCSDFDNNGRINFYDSIGNYNAIYFPNFYDINVEEQYCKNENEQRALYDEYHQVGNDLPYNSKINQFIENAAKAIDLYKKHQINDEIYNIVINGLLDNLDK